MKKKKTPPPSQQKTLSTPKWVYYVLFGFAFLLYANTLNHDYVYDDAFAIKDNKLTKQGFKGIPDLVTKDYFVGFFGENARIEGGRWRPLSLVMFATEYQLFGLNPQVGHLINVMLYAITAIVFFIALQKMLPGKFLLNFLATLIFLVHPVHTEVVANIKSRDEILSLLGVCLALIWLIKSHQTQQTKYIVFAAIAYFLALTGKENVITFVVIFPMIYFFFLNRNIFQSLKSSFPFFIAAAVYVLIRWQLVGLTGGEASENIMDNPYLGAALADKYATITKVLGKYLLLLFFPWTLTPDYSYNEIPIISWSNPAAILSLLIHLFLIVYSVSYLFVKNPSDTRKIISFGIIFYLITIAIVSNIPINIGAPMGERFLYLPSMGFSLAITALLLALLKVREWDSLKLSFNKLIPFIIILLFFSIRTVARNPEWKTDEILDAAGVKAAPNCARLHDGYADDLWKKRQKTNDAVLQRKYTEQALKELKRVEEIYPKEDKFLSNLYYKMAMLEQTLGDTLSAEKHFLLSITFNPTSPDPLDGYGSLLFSKKAYATALPYFLKAIHYNPDYSDALAYTGASYHNLKQYNKAIPYYERALALSPHFTIIADNLREVRKLTGDTIKN